MNPNSLADQAGLKIGDIIVGIGDANAELMRHKEAQEAIVSAGNYLTMTVQRSVSLRPNKQTDRQWYLIAGAKWALGDQVSRQ